MTVETKDITVANVPVEALEFLRPFAVRDGRSGMSDAAVMKYALIECAKLKRESGDDDES